MSELKGDATLMRLLELIDTEMSLQMLQDLRDPERRTPQLYQAVNRFLDRHDFGIKTLMIDKQVMGELQETAAAAIQKFFEAEQADGDYQH